MPRSFGSKPGEHRGQIAQHANMLANRERVRVLAWAAHTAGDHPTNGELARKMGLHAETVGRYVRALVAAGLYPSFPAGDRRRGPRPGRRTYGTAPPAPVPSPAEIAERAAAIRKERTSLGDGSIPRRRMAKGNLP